MLISSCIFPENDKSEILCQSILDTLKEKASLLKQWIAVHESMYGNNYDIPSNKSIHLSKIRDGIVTTDTCNSARALSEFISFEIEVTELKHVFKLSQNRDEASKANIHAELSKGDAACKHMAAAMKAQSNPKDSHKNL